MQQKLWITKNINAVLIATRHDSHAELTIRALSKGKAVLVEKPLGLTKQELNSVKEARVEFKFIYPSRV